ncbi:hypothetical protein [Marilutibacter maris]|uniref:hypothetical protein n=1 Tax=Marilutibacter maris TaxID=1605891 RepID=UPI0014791E14|nr:hypothetical protein [Lysobacter maris]
MRDIDADEVGFVNGGVVPFAPIVAVVVATVAAGAYLGEKMAERDNRQTTA